MGCGSISVAFLREVISSVAAGELFLLVSVLAAVAAGIAPGGVLQPSGSTQRFETTWPPGFGLGAFLNRDRKSQSARPFDVRATVPVIRRSGRSPYTVWAIEVATNPR